MAVETHLMMMTLPFVVQVTDEAPRPEAMHEALLVSFNCVPLYSHEGMSPEELIVKTRLAPLFTMKPPLLGVAPNDACACRGADRQITEPTSRTATRTNCAGLFKQ